MSLRVSGNGSPWPCAAGFSGCVDPCAQCMAWWGNTALYEEQARMLVAMLEHTDEAGILFELAERP